MPLADLGTHQLYYEAFGDSADPTAVLLPGLGSQLLLWEEEFCQGLADRYFHVVRVDQRDAGLSTPFDGRPPYGLDDMAADIVGLLDVLGVGTVTAVGLSMGGMIAQTMAINHPERVASLTSIASTSGEPGLGAPTLEAMDALMGAPASTERDAVVEFDVASRRVWASPTEFDEDAVRAYFQTSYDRAYNPDGGTRQMLAVQEAPDRSAGLAALATPTLVVHGTADTLIGLEAGERTAELITGAELLVLEGMGHDLPPLFWAPIIEAITQLASRST